MDKGKLANLLKNVEKGLFLANRDLKALEQLLKRVEGILKELALAEQESKKTEALSKELALQMKQLRVVDQGQELFNRIEGLGSELERLSMQMQEARAFVESHRMARLYSFQDGNSAAGFARQALELFSLESVLFKPRFIGTIDLDAFARELRLKRTKEGLLLHPKDVKPVARKLAEKRLSSNISLHGPNLKLVWEDSKTISVQASTEKLFRLDRLCDALNGKCIEK